MTRILSLRQRRLAVIGQLVSFPVILSMGSWLSLSVGWTTLFALFIYLASAFYLYRGTGLWHYGNAPDELLDERQVQVRNRAYRLGYSFVSLLLIMLISYLLMAADMGWSSLAAYDQRSGLFWTLFAVVLVLPSAILAWTEPEV